VARLTRIPASKPQLPWGIFRGKMRMSEDFNEPLEEMKDYL
jgi:hypothetical protein